MTPTQKRILDIYITNTTNSRRLSPPARKTCWSCRILIIFCAGILMFEFLRLYLGA